MFSMAQKSRIKISAELADKVMKTLDRKCYRKDAGLAMAFVISFSFGKSQIDNIHSVALLLKSKRQRRRFTQAMRG